MDMNKLTAVGTIILAVMAVLTYLGSSETPSPQFISNSVYNNHAEASAAGPGGTSSATSNVIINNSSTVIDNRISVGGNGVAVGAGANVNIITNTKSADN